MLTKRHLDGINCVRIIKGQPPELNYSIAAGLGKSAAGGDSF